MKHWSTLLHHIDDKICRPSERGREQETIKKENTLVKCVWGSTTKTTENKISLFNVDPGICIYIMYICVWWVQRAHQRVSSMMNCNQIWQQLQSESIYILWSAVKQSYLLTVTHLKCLKYWLIVLWPELRWLANLTTKYGALLLDISNDLYTVPYAISSTFT